MVQGIDLHLRISLDPLSTALGLVSVVHILFTVRVDSSLGIVSSDAFH